MKMYVKTSLGNESLTVSWPDDAGRSRAVAYVVLATTDSLVGDVFPFLGAEGCPRRQGWC
jgi:hypothetical protein